KIIISIAETAIFLYVVKILVIRQTLASTLAYPILFISLFILFLMKRGYFSNFVDRKLFSILGRYGYTAYVMSYVTGIFLMNIVWNNKDIGISAYPMLHLALYIVFTYGIAVLVYHGIEKPIGNILKRTYKNSKKV
ncbi:hypothetical protein, partial [uncultured Desulfovibrio sp.]